MGSYEWFRPLYIISSIWKNTGFDAVIFMAAISGIDPELYEAAAIDGSTRFKNVYLITLPIILPTIMFCLFRKTESFISLTA